MFFKYSLILLRYTSIDSVLFLFPSPSYSILNIISAPEITYFYWFITSFFFLLRKVAYVCLEMVLSVVASLLLETKNISYIFNCIVVYLFFNLKIFLTSLMMLSSIFYLFEALNYPSLCVVKKIINFLKK